MAKILMLVVLGRSQQRPLHDEHVTRNGNSKMHLLLLYHLLERLGGYGMYSSGSHQLFACALQTLQLFRQFLTATCDLG